MSSTGRSSRPAAAQMAGSHSLVSHRACKAPSAAPSTCRNGVTASAIGVAATLLLSLFFSGCTKYPQVSFSNRAYAAALRTACSAQDPAMLSDTEKVIRHDQLDGRIGDDEMKSYESIIALARSGDWKRAEIECHRFQKDQLAR